jgi:hypothetical protein
MSDRKKIKCDNCGKLLLVVVNGLCSDCRPAPSATVGDEEAAEEFGKQAWRYESFRETTLEEAFLAGCAFKEFQMCERIAELESRLTKREMYFANELKKAEKAERERILSAANKAWDSILNPVADDSGVE